MIHFGTQITTIQSQNHSFSTWKLGCRKDPINKGIYEGTGNSKRCDITNILNCYEYEGAIPLLHIDLYRVSPMNKALDLEEIIENWVGWTVVEWGNIHPDILPFQSYLFEYSNRKGTSEHQLYSSRHGRFSKKCIKNGSII